MLTKEEKKQKRNKFLKSNEFGEDAYTSLFGFRHNSIGFLNTANFYYKLIEKVEDKSFFEHTLDEQHVVDVKQRIFLDIISKSINLSEGLFILIKSLDEGYSTIAKNMVKYKSRMVWNTIRNIQENKLDLQKILALPEIEKLELDDDEKKFLEKLSSDTKSKISDQLKELCDFYENYNIVYNKTRHGMTIFTGGFFVDRPKTLENSSLIAFDHKALKEHMPKGYFETQIQVIEKRWFNAKAQLNFNKKFHTEIGRILNILHYLSDYIVSNHFTFLNNCGESYVPFKQKGNKAGIWYNSEEKNKPENKKMVISIENKLFPNLLGSPFSFNINDDYKGTSLEKIVPKNSITNIWIQDEPLEKHN